MKKVSDLNISSWTDNQLKVLLEETTKECLVRGFSTEHTDILSMYESLRQLQEDVDAVVDEFRESFCSEIEDD